MSILDQVRACHAAGLTVPETAAALNRSRSLIYRWAKQHGLQFANRKVPPPKIMSPEAQAKRRVAHAAAMERVRNSRVNGWTWAELMDLGYTAPQAARMRGQTVEAAYKAQEALGRSFYRVHLRGLSDKERRKLSRIQRDYNVPRDTALEIMGREDLIQHRPCERDRLVARAKRDPESVMLALMKLNAERNVV